MQDLAIWEKKRKIMNSAINYQAKVAVQLPPCIGVSEKTSGEIPIPSNNWTSLIFTVDMVRGGGGQGGWNRHDYSQNQNQCITNMYINWFPSYKRLI